jgi:predicted dehydrogenase
VTQEEVNDQSPLGVAVVGYGYWGPNLARVVRGCADTELRLICDSSDDARGRAAATFPEAAVTAAWDDVLADESVDAVVLALPVPQHFSFALEALESGRHVLVEKPLALSVDECDRLAAAAAANDRTLMAGHTFEFHAAVNLVKDYLDSGELGDPYYVSMRRTNLGIVRSDINAMWSLAPHDVSILCRWLGREPVAVSAEGVARLQDGIEDVVFMTVRFEGDVLAHIHCSWLNPSKVRESTVVGSKKMVVYDDVSTDAKVRLYDKGVDRQETGDSLGRYEDFGRFQLLARAGDVLIPKIDFREPLAEQIAHFAECAISGAEPRTGAANARRVVSVLEAAQQSLKEGGEIAVPGPPATVS